VTSNLHDRMANLRIENSPDMAERQIAAIRTELVTPAPVTVPARRRLNRRPVFALIAAVILLLPAAAIGAENTVPGDVLYPAKRATEWFRSFVDDDVAARHRVEELENVLRRGEPIDVVTDLLTKTEEAVEDAPPALVQRVERVRERIRNEPETVENDATGGTTPSRNPTEGSSKQEPDTGPLPTDPQNPGTVKSDTQNPDTGPADAEQDGSASRSGTTTTVQSRTSAPPGDHGNDR